MRIMGRGWIGARKTLVSEAPLQHLQGVDAVPACAK